MKYGGVDKLKKTKGKNKKSRLRMLAENKGVYIALFSLVAVVGFYVYARYLQTSAEKDLLSSAIRQVLFQIGLPSLSYVCSKS